jgi:hyperosmotically inducible protein
MRNRITRLWMGWMLATVLALPALARQPARTDGAGDRKIQQDVTTLLQGDKSWKEVRATVDHGVVRLTGSVQLYRDKAKLEQKIRHRDHVAGLRNDVEIAGASVPDLPLRDRLADKLRYDRVGFGNVFNTLTLDVRNGVVTVGGIVRSDIDKESALSAVADTPGVKDVVDQIAVAPASIYDDRLRIALARAIYRRLPPMYGQDPQAPIRIVVVNGRVELDGVVSSKVDRQIAELQARSVPGVFSVTDRLQVAGQPTAVE